MKRLLVIAILAAGIAGCAQAQKGPAFDAWFVDRTMRVDYFHSGHSAEETFALDQVYDQGPWAGSRAHLIDPFELGRYMVKIYDDASGTLLFSKGFDSYFGEYKTSDAALKGVRRTYLESALLPYPKKPVRFTVEARDRQNAWKVLFSQAIDPAARPSSASGSSPASGSSKPSSPASPGARSTSPSSARATPRPRTGKFKADLDRFAGIFLGAEPYTRTGPSSTSPASSSPRRKAAATSRATARQGDRPRRDLRLPRLRALPPHRGQPGRARHRRPCPYDALFIMVNH